MKIDPKTGKVLSRKKSFPIYHVPEPKTEITTNFFEILLDPEPEPVIPIDSTIEKSSNELLPKKKRTKTKKKI